MEIISFFIILMLAGFLVATIYLLYRKKDGKSVCIPITESQKTPFNESYTLNYNNKSSGLTFGDTALYVRISNIHTGQHSENKIYYDSDLKSGYITVGRAESNNYYLKSKYIDNQVAFYLAKYDTEFKIKANSNSRNGLSYEYQGSPIKDIITFDQNITLYMGPIRFDFAVSGFEHQENGIGREDIFGSRSSSDRDATSIFG